MAHYQRVGAIPPKRHTQHRDEQGRLYFEELMGEEGFSSDSSLLYHRELPSRITGAREWELPDQTLTANHPLRPLHLRLHALFPGTARAGHASLADASLADASLTEASEVDVVRHRRLVLGNADVRISYVVAQAPSPWYRNAIGDECLYVERGSARVETVFGALDVGRGDYVVLPRATTHRWVPTAPADDRDGESLRVLCLEFSSHVAPPQRFRSRFGQLLEHAPYCERDLRTPRGPLLAEDIGASRNDEIEVYVKHRGPRPGGIAGTIHAHPFHVLDVVGWDGCLYPYAFNIADYEPITGRIHQPPPAHQVFEAANVVLCNFVPRKVDYHPLAIPVPYYHSNVDSDEVMFYVDGDYEARKGSGIGNGSISLHPGGHAHGPQPGAYERSIGRDSFDELAVMVDTFRPLELGEGALAVDDGLYLLSWHRDESAPAGGRP